MSLTNKIAHFPAGKKDRRYRVRIDELPFSYRKSHEAMEVITNNVIATRRLKKLVS